MKLIGFRKVDFSRDGTEVHGYNLYCTFDDRNTVGEAVERLWVNDRVLVNAGDLRLGAEIIPLYNKYGKIVGVQFCD